MALTNMAMTILRTSAAQTARSSRAPIRSVHDHEHGDTKNGGMPTMKMALRCRIPVMMPRAIASEKAKVRVENAGGTLTNVRLSAIARAHAQSDDRA